MAIGRNGRDPEATAIASLPWESLPELPSLEALRECSDPHLMQLCGGLLQTFSQLATSQVHVHHGCVHAAVSGESRDLMYVPPGAGQIGQAQVTKSVSGETRQMGLLRKGLYG